MLHQRTPAASRSNRSIVTRLRFAAAGAMLLVPLIPALLRELTLPYGASEASTINSLLANAAAVVIAFWARVSVQTYPGTRAGAILLPAIVVGHGLVLIAMLMARLPYDRLSMALGFAIHLAWAYGLALTVQRRARQRIAIVPFGDVKLLLSVTGVDWTEMSRPDLAEAAGCDAIVADFSADLPDAWEALLADAAIEGRVVYQVKQLYESLTGRVRIAHLSENSFGSLVPMRGYAHVKSVADWLFAAALLPLAAPLMLLVAVAIRLDSRGPALFRQKRVGRRGVPITVYKFRTMRVVDMDGDEGDRSSAVTVSGDARITRLGAWLRKTRIDELPQMLNILKNEMSWIGPRPEAEVLSSWYSGEIPFYRYRHVVKPGISGWAQVNQGHVALVDEVHEKLQYDFFYIKYFSPWLDVLILFRTLKTMLTGFGAR